jgi:predicted RNase H-like HicB family nuclease
MHYPIAIEPGGERHAYGVVVPDLPGCFSAGDTLEEAIANAQEAILLWLEDRVEAGEAIPEPQPIEVHRKSRSYAGWIWAVSNVDLSHMEDKTERVNITVPRRVLHAVDEAARRSGESRSGFLARAGLAQARAHTGSLRTGEFKRTSNRRVSVASSAGGKKVKPGKRK